MQSSAAPLEIRTLTEISQLHSLAAEWSELWQQSVRATPFQTSEWILAWLKHLGPADLQVVTFRQQGRLCGLAPLQIHTDSRGPRKLMLLGSGISDYLDLLAAPPWAGKVVSALLEFLTQRASDWDVCDFLSLDGEGPLVQGLQTTSLRRYLQRQESCPRLKLPERGHDLASCLPAGQYKKLAYYRRRLARAGDVEVQRAEPANLEEMLSSFIALHAARWNNRDQAGVLAEHAIQCFHREVARQMLQRGWLRLYGLRLESQTIAAYYGFLCRGRSYYYLGGFDPQWRSFSPGMVIVGHAIEEAIAEGAEVIDFLRGQEPYKYDWGARDYITYRFACPSQALLARDADRTGRSLQAEEKISAQ